MRNSIKSVNKIFNNKTNYINDNFIESNNKKIYNSKTNNNLNNNNKTNYNINKSKSNNINIKNYNNNSNNNNNNNNINNNNKIQIPKPQLRMIKVPSFCSDFICKKDTFNTIKEVHENYKEIQFLLDIVHYLKSQNELNIIGKYLFTEEQRKALSYTYIFETDFGLERKGYEYMIKHKKNFMKNKGIIYFQKE